MDSQEVAVQQPLSEWQPLTQRELRTLRARERYAQQKAERIANGEQVRGPGRPKVYSTEEEALEARRRRKRLYMQKKRSQL